MSLIYEQENSSLFIHTSIFVKIKFGRHGLGANHAEQGNFFKNLPNVELIQLYHHHSVDLLQLIILIMTKKALIWEQAYFLKSTALRSE